MPIKNRNGFIAITSAVVIAVLLMAVALSLNLTGFFARFNILETEYKERSFSLAEGCAETALLKLAIDSEYLGNEIISLGELDCEILPLTESGGQITIRTKAYFPQNVANKAATNLFFVVDKVDLDILSWGEVPVHT